MSNHLSKVRKDQPSDQQACKDCTVPLAWTWIGALVSVVCSIAPTAGVFGAPLVGRAVEIGAGSGIRVIICISCIWLRST